MNDRKHEGFFQKMQTRSWSWWRWTVPALLIPLATACSSRPPRSDDGQDMSGRSPDAGASPVFIARLVSAERAARRALRAERALRGARAMLRVDEAEVLVTASGIRVRFLTPLFGEDTTDLDSAAPDRIARLRAAIGMFPDPKVVIHAPTASEGSHEANLAQMRASQLRRVLLRLHAVREDRVFIRLDRNVGPTLEVAIGNGATFDHDPRPSSDVARL